MELLDKSISEIKEIPQSFRRKFQKLGISTLKDLLFYFPRRYENFSKIVPISQLKINQTACIEVEVKFIENVKTYKKKFIITQALVSDKSGTLKVVWFNQPFLTRTIKEGDKVYLAGKLAYTKEGSLFQNPILEKITPKKKVCLHTKRIVPIYSETERITSRWIRFAIYPILKKFAKETPEILPDFLIRELSLMPVQEAIFEIHFPSSLSKARKARYRFAFQELLLLELFILREKYQKRLEKAPKIAPKIEIIKEFVKFLPFSLTDDQKKAAWQILKDMEKNFPMTRLLQGDVGSGKTVVAALASLNTAKNSYQVAFMAPTEILAKQHFETFREFLKNFNLNIGLLTSKKDLLISKKLPKETIEISKRRLLEKTQKGEIDILIGTHSLIQEKVKFKKLGLVIVDEQHRFGVYQRAKLIKKEKSEEGNSLPHLLSMTATPIPRTLALTVYGDLDISLLRKMPKGPRKVETIVFSPKQRKKAYKLIRREIERGRQAFVICPRIETNNSKIEMKAVKEEYEKLSKKVFPDFAIGILHGKMSATEKEKVMRNLRKGKIQILVSTSVVEVGIDVPNATVMLVEGAERFGLAQLHQFRGRIGRGGDKSYFLLFSESSSRKVYQRLKSLEKVNNGLELAEIDLKIRGPGDFIGKRQWGIPDLAMASLQDIELVELARESAKKILEKDFFLKNYPLLAKELSKFKKEVHFE